MDQHPSNFHPQSKKVFLEGFRRGTCIPNIRKLLEPFGEIEKIKKSKNKGLRGSNYAIITFQSQETANSVLQTGVSQGETILKVSEFMNRDDLEITRRSKIRRRIFVKGLPPLLDINRVIQNIQLNYGEVDSSKIIVKGNKRMLRVTFLHQESRDSCVQQSVISIENGLYSVEEQKYGYVASIKKETFPSEENSYDQQPNTRLKAVHADTHKNISNLEVINGDQDWTGSPLTPQLHLTRELLLKKENGDVVLYDHSQYMINPGRKGYSSTKKW